MPSSRITATTASTCVDERCANSLWSIAMSVMRPALSCASVAPGTSRSTRAATCCRRCALRARVASSCAYSVVSASPSRKRATAPFSATIASTGHARANGSLQPAGRPVIAITGSPAASSCVSAASASGVIAPAVVSVSSMSVRTPITARASAPVSSAQGSGVVVARKVTLMRGSLAQAFARLAWGVYNCVSFRGALQGPPRVAPGSECADCNRVQPRSPARFDLVGEFQLSLRVRVRVPQFFGARYERRPQAHR